jgi:Ring finger domain
MREHPGLADRIVIRQQVAESVVASLNQPSHARFQVVTFSWDNANSNNDNNNNGDNSNNLSTNPRGHELLLRAKTHHYPKGNQGEAVGDPLKKPSASGMETEPTIIIGQEDTDVKEIHNGDDDDDGASMVSTACVFCPICHTEIEEGDRVGNIPCNHVMHIECLKTWIVRRNVCPLCLVEDIATPRQESNQQTSDTQSSHIVLPELVVTGE